MCVFLDLVCFSSFAEVCQSVFNIVSTSLRIIWVSHKGVFGSFVGIHLVLKAGDEHKRRVGDRFRLSPPPLIIIIIIIPIIIIPIITCPASPGCSGGSRGCPGPRPGPGWRSGLPRWRYTISGGSCLQDIYPFPHFSVYFTGIKLK